MEKIKERTMLNQREKVFCSGKNPDIFEMFQMLQHFSEEDPFDVQEIHLEGRDVFKRYLNMVGTPDSQQKSSILLFLGETGAGKTHLMRSFRNYTHTDQLGYFVGLQITAETKNYERYLLSHVINSLDFPYSSQNKISGLKRLSNALIHRQGVIDPKQREELLCADYDPEKIGRMIYSLTHKVKQDPILAPVPAELISALLYLQTDYSELKSPVYKYLRCQTLNRYEKDSVRALGANSAEEIDPLQMVQNLGHLIWLLEESVLIFCVDQFEDLIDYYSDSESTAKFQTTVRTLVALSGQLPNSLILLSCLKSYYEDYKESLPQSYRERLENSPVPVLLKGKLDSVEAIQMLLHNRLSYLYEKNGVSFSDQELDDNSTFPFSMEQVESFQGLRLREILKRCKVYREECIQRNSLIEDVPDIPLAEEKTEDSTAEDPVRILENSWDSFLNDLDITVDQKEKDLAELLSWGLASAWKELTSGGDITISNRENCIRVKNGKHSLFIGLCNRPTAGGSLGKQIALFESQAKGGDRKILVRTGDFPKTKTSKVYQQITKLLEEGGSKLSIQDAEWRFMKAMRLFADDNQENPNIVLWQQQYKHLASLPVIRAILEIDSFSESDSEDEEDISTSKAIPSSEEEMSTQIENKNVPGVLIGSNKSSSKEPLSLPVEQLLQHVAILGGTGSGKTSLALNVVEQLLVRGIPVIMIDRKGDLCGYGKDSFWSQSNSDPDREKRVREFQQQVKVDLFTPGNPMGRPLSINVLPEKLGELDLVEQERVCRYTASAIAGMMGYRSAAEKKRIPILAKAIQLLGDSNEGKRMDLSELINFIRHQNAELIQEIGKFDKRLFKTIAEDLQILKLNTQSLISGENRLNISRLLAQRVDPVSKKKKVPLTVISTKFLHDNQQVQFWVTRFLMEVNQWMNQHPSKDLQVAIFFDEADLYLPAQSKPSTKEPMENLLKRARSAGISLLLATQNPGDFDYKCRDNIRSWFVGRIKEERALQKLRPMFQADDTVDYKTAFSNQDTGEFHFLCESRFEQFQADCSLASTEQYPEKEILQLARLSKAKPTSNSKRDPNQLIAQCGKCKKRFLFHKRLTGRKAKCPACKSVMELKPQ